MGVCCHKTAPWELDLSIIVPVKEEADSIFGLAEEIQRAMNGTGWSWECLWVDDGSTDHTLSRLMQLHRQDPHHQYIALSQNYGQSAAIYVGFCYARGELLATLDGDGQNDPSDIPTMVRRMKEDDIDMVNGYRKMRQDNLIRKISSRIANGFRNWVTREQVRDVGCSVRVFRRRCVEHVPLFRGMHRFLPTLVQIGGCDKIVEMAVNHRPRKYGQTKYGIHNRLWTGLMDTLAVRWMQTRTVRPQVDRSSRNEGGQTGP